MINIDNVEMLKVMKKCVRENCQDNQWHNIDKDVKDEC